MEIKKSKFNVGDPVTVRCDEASMPSFFTATVVAVVCRRSDNVHEYTVTETGFDRTDGYTDEWLTAREPAKDPFQALCEEVLGHAVGLFDVQKLRQICDKFGDKRVADATLQASNIHHELELLLGYKCLPSQMPRFLADKVAFLNYTILRAREMMLVMNNMTYPLPEQTRKYEVFQLLDKAMGVPTASTAHPPVPDKTAKVPTYDTVMQGGGP